MNSTTPSPTNALTVREVKTRAVRVPLTFALGTSAAIVNAVPLLLVDVYMEEGIGAPIFSATPPRAPRRWRRILRKLCSWRRGSPRSRKASPRCFPGDSRYLA